MDWEIRNFFVTLRKFGTALSEYVIEALGIKERIGGWHLRPSLGQGEFVYNIANLCGVDLWLSAEEKE